MGKYQAYVDTINRHWLNGRIDHETWRRRQNKLLEWYNNGKEVRG